MYSECMKENEEGSKTGRLLNVLAGALCDGAVYALNVADAFLMSAGSARLLARNMNMVDREYYSSMQSLERHGYVKKVNQNQFLITPKGLKRAKMESLCKVSSEAIKGNSEKGGDWYLVVFDIPDEKSRKRNIFRSVLKRYGFIGLQLSTYVAPFADFERLASLRDELGISEYVTFMRARVATTDSDEKLKAYFEKK